MELTYQTNKKKRRVRCVAVIIAIIVAFFIGFLIGYVAIKAKEHDDKPEKHNRKADFQKRREETMIYHKEFQTTVSEDKLKESLK